MTFITYSFIGWLWESFYCSIKAKHFVYRGFLLGPYCPVYGFGVTAVLLLVPEHAGSLLNLYLNVVVIVTVIEYVTSWLLEKLFNMSLWNYSKIPMNIDGRVAVPVSLFWGVGCVLLIKVINPNIQDAIHDFISATNGIGPIIVFFIFMADVISTLVFTETTKKEVESVVDSSDPENASIKEYRMKHLFNNDKSSAVRERILYSLKSKPMKIRHYTLSRIVKNYPNIIFNKKENKN